MRSITTGSPVIFLPKIIGKWGTFIGSTVERRSLNPIIDLLSLGTSIPTACLPGIGATILTVRAANSIAMLSAKLLIELTLTLELR